MLSRLKQVLLAFAVLWPVSALVAPAQTLIPLYTEGNTNAVNPDSVLIDTSTTSATYREHYAKRWFQVNFDSYVIDVPAAPRDSVIEVDWEEIDTTYSACRAGFAALEQQFGSFVLRKKFPDKTTPQLLASRVYLMRFSAPVCLSHVESALSGIPNVGHSFYCNRAATLLGMPNEPGFIPGTAISEVTDPEPFSNPPRADRHRLGWQWGLHAVGLPLAWEISEGSSDVIIGIDDAFNPEHPTYGSDPMHPDVAEGTNYLYESDPGDGSESMHPLYDEGHGFNNVAISVALKNGAGSIGVAPGCMALGTQMGTQYSLLDSDPLTAGIQVPHVMNCSYNNPRIDDAVYSASIRDGVVVVAASGNAMYASGLSICEWFIGKGPKNKDGVQINYYGVDNQCRHTPAHCVELHPSEPQKDIKVIAVGAVNNGDFTNCGIAGVGDSYYQNNGERFPPTFFSSDLASKFAVGPHRDYDKVWSGMDLVVPHEILTATGASPYYAPTQGGTSRCAPVVAGIVGLMRSVDTDLGAQADPNGSLADVHRNAYDILTFTADKVEDNGAQPAPDDYWDFDIINGQGQVVEIKRYFIVLPEETQFDYLEQTNDNLKRTWAQRMGFGMVNAFRALAHSIPAKGPYEYTSAGQLDIDAQGHLLAGRHFLHWGAKVNEQKDIGSDRDGGGIENKVLNVLEWGGTSLPGEAHNNQGYTRLRGSSMNLTVAGDEVLVIDGIVSSNSPTANNKVLTAAKTGFETAHGAILATGYVENVTLEGRLKLNKLIVNADNGGTGGLKFRNHGAGVEASRSEVYQLLSLQNDATCTLSGGASLAVLPGGGFDLQGNNDVIIENGATMELHYPTSINAIAGRGIVVQNGGKLVIKAKPGNDVIWRTAIEALVTVEAGGELLVENGAYCALSEFDIQTDGTLRLEAGGTLILDNPAIGAYAIAGHLLVEGSAQNRATILGPLDECGDPAGWAEIRAAGNLSQVLESQVSVDYADFKNVFLTVQDMRLGKMENSNFNADRALGGAPPAAMLSIAYSAAEPHALLQNLGILNCRFTDDAGVLPGIRDEYPFNGIYLEQVKPTVYQCNFSFLKNGLLSERCLKLYYTENVFGHCNTGIRDAASALYLCSNSFNTVEFGADFNTSKTGAMHGNVYTFVHTGQTGLNSSVHWLRDNHFNDLQHGVFVMGGETRLHSQRGSFVQNTYYGANVFKYLPRATEPINPFVDPDLVRADIRMEKYANVHLECGYSQYSNNHDNVLNTHWYHLLGDEAMTIPDITVSNNSWPTETGFLVRSKWLTAMGSPIDQQQTATGCGPYGVIGCEPCYGCNPADPFTNDGDYAEKSAAWRDDAYTDALVMIGDPSGDAAYREIKLRDALELAALGPSSAGKLNTLIGVYAGVAADAALPLKMRSTALMLQGEARERLNLPNDAMQSYMQVSASFPNQADVLPANWRIQYLQAESADPQHGSAWRQAMQDLDERILADLRGLSGSGLPKQGPGADGAAIAGGIELEAPRPNPSSSACELVFHLAQGQNLRLVLVDALGQTLATLSEGYFSAGSHSVSVPTSAFESGLYWCRLITASGSKVQALAVQH